MDFNQALASEHIPQALRDAVNLAPGNAPLLAHLAEILLAGGATDAAETLSRAALAIQPALPAAQLALATAFYRQGKYPLALVLVEELIKKNQPPPPKAHLLLARLALNTGDKPAAARHYAAAKTADPALTDAALENEIGAPARAPLRPAANDTPGDNTPPPPYPERERAPAGDLPPAAPAGIAEVERPAITFADVGGMDAIKEEVRMKIILPFQKPDLFKAYGKKAGGGILMYGPPGCGKTFLARATAGEVKSNFISVGISDVLDMWIGQSERNLRAIFQQARRHRPCVLFFDEVDALGASRADMLKSAGRHLINQFLSELDGIASSNDEVLILAATNTPWHIDPAFRRPGRFDRILFVPPPDASARAVILRLHLAGKPQADIDHAAIARQTNEYSGADLKAIVDIATEAKLRESMRTGKLHPLATADLLAAIAVHRSSVSDWFETSRNYALYANQGGQYDDIAAYLKRRR